MTSPAHQPVLILASGSPRRRYLLRQAGLAFKVMPSHIDEAAIGAESPETFARQLAMAKAQEVASRLGTSWVLGADTIVVLDDAILGKPQHPGEARAMLERLSGREHEVITGWCLQHHGQQRCITDRAITRVRFKPLSRVEIDWYLATGEPFDKAGAYGIQGQGAFLVRHINGSYTNVVGLPVCEVIEALAAEGILGQVRMKG